MILRLAEKYGQAPQDVADWDLYWINRAWVLAVAEAEHSANLIEK
jgi:hypothetical protein